MRVVAGRVKHQCCGQRRAWRGVPKCNNIFIEKGKPPNFGFKDPVRLH